MYSYQFSSKLVHYLTCVWLVSFGSFLQKLSFLIEAKTERNCNLLLRRYVKHKLCALLDSRLESKLLIYHLLWGEKTTLRQVHHSRAEKWHWLLFLYPLQSIDPGQQFTWEHSNLEVNKAKNRYANVIAYDHSRVLLSSIDGMSGLRLFKLLACISWRILIKHFQLHCHINCQFA